MTTNNERLGRQELDTFNIRRPVARMKAAAFRHKGLVALTTIFLVGLVVTYIALWPKVYSAKVLLYVEEDKDESRDDFYSGWAVFRKDDVKSELHLIKTGPVMERVVKDLGLKYEDVYHPFLTYASELWRSSWPGTQYHHLKEYFFPPKKSKWDPTPEQKELARTVIDLEKGLSLSPVKESHVGELVVKGPTPQVAEIANKIAEVYIERRNKIHRHEAEEAFATLDQHVIDARARLEKAEKRVRDYTNANGIYFDFEREKGALRKLSTLRNEIVHAEADIATLKQTLIEINRQLAGQERERVRTRTFAMNELLRSMKQTRFEQQAALLTLRQQFTSKSPEVRDTEATISNLTEMIKATPTIIETGQTKELNTIYDGLLQRRNALLASLAGAGASLEILKESAAEITKRLASLPEKRQTLTDLERERRMVENVYTALLDKRVQARMSIVTAGSTMPSMRIAEHAYPPAEPVAPRTKLLLLVALILGLGAGIVAALLKELYSNRVRKGMETEVIKLPVLARIDVGAAGASDLLRTNGRTAARQTTESLN